MHFRAYNLHYVYDSMVLCSPNWRAIHDNMLQCILRRRLTIIQISTGLSNQGFAMAKMGGRGVMARYIQYPVSLRPARLDNNMIIAIRIFMIIVDDIGQLLTTRTFHGCVEWKTRKSVKSSKVFLPLFCYYNSSINVLS